MKWMDRLIHRPRFFVRLRMDCRRRDHADRAEKNECAYLHRWFPGTHAVSGSDRLDLWSTLSEGASCRKLLFAQGHRTRKCALAFEALGGWPRSGLRTKWGRKRLIQLGREAGCSTGRSGSICTKSSPGAGGFVPESQRDVAEEFERRRFTRRPTPIDPPMK